MRVEQIEMVVDLLAFAELARTTTASASWGSSSSSGDPAIATSPISSP